MSAAAVNLAPASAPEVTASTPGQLASALSGLPLRRGGEVDDPVSGAWMLIALLMVAAVAVIWFRRKAKVGPASRTALRRVESLALTPQGTLHVVVWGDEEILLGCSQAGVNVISRRVPPATSDAPQS